MRIIDENKINALLDKGAGARDSFEIDRILAKSLSLKRLSLQEASVLLSVNGPQQKARIFQAAAAVKDRIYGKRVVLFAPLYISNLCRNTCLYCAFKADNELTQRRALSPEEIKQQVEWLLARGHKRVLLVSGEAAPGGLSEVDYYVQSVRAVYEASFGQHRIKRVNINCAPLSVEDFRKLKQSAIGTFQIFQETYHDSTYRKVHVRGPKSDPDNRLDAVDRAFQAGIDDVGIGALYGLYDYRFETLGLLSHVEHLENKFGVGPHTISVPRLEPAQGVDFLEHTAYRVTDEQFRLLVAVLRLAVPYTGLIMSTRETAGMRDELLALGVSQISAESRTCPGGYSSEDNNASNEKQFALGDQRTLDEVMASLLERGFIPSFCAACYRKERTGKAFMDMAKPGMIKGKCSINALVTLKEYLDDFAGPLVKSAGYRLIEKSLPDVPEEDKALLQILFSAVDRGKRDEYV